MADKNTIKNWFRTGLRPSQAQFWATWDSFWHKDEKIPIDAINDIQNILAEKADAEALVNHLTNETAHADLFDGKEDKDKKGIADGYAPLNNFTKLAIEYLNVVNDLVTGGVDSLLSAEQGKLLQNQIDNINVLLTSDNVNLDNVQEIVDAIETVQMSLSTILVNDLTTGGTMKALSAEMGKSLKGLIDNLANNKEDVANKQNSLVADVTNNRYPNVTAVIDGLALKANLDNPGLIGNVKASGYQNIYGEKLFNDVANFTKTTIAARYYGPINLTVNTLTSNVYAGAVVIGSLNGNFGFASNGCGRALFSTFNISDVVRTFTLPNKDGTVAMIADIPVALSGIYTPTVTINSNLSALTTSGGVWTRVNNIVTVTVSIDFTGTDANIQTGFSISVPIPMHLQNTVALRNLGMATFIAPFVPVICANVQEGFPNVNINFFIASVSNSYTGAVTFSYILP